MISHPIVQTSVDTILRGCLEISEDFAVAFLETVKGWHSEENDDDDEKQTRNLAAAIHYVNDRFAQSTFAVIQRGPCNTPKESIA